MPALLPYCGPVDTLARFRAGEIVTRTDFVTDLSVWTVEVIEPAARDRLWWMIENLELDEDNRIVRRRG